MLFLIFLHFKLLILLFFFCDIFSVLADNILLVFLIAMVCVTGVAFLGFHVRRGLLEVRRVIQRGP